MKVLNGAKIKKQKRGFLWEIAHNRVLYLLTLPALLYVLLFKYAPMAGIVIAFQKYIPLKGIFGSPFVGIQNFIFFFRGSSWASITFNTFYLNMLFIVSGTIAAVFIAIIMTQLRKGVYVRVAQSVMILPNFISWVVIAMFAVAFIGSNGIINQMLSSMGKNQIAFYNNAGVWPALFVIVKIWQGAGFGAIIYMATITGIDTEIFEAASIDGASKLSCIFRITLPLLKDTVILLTLMGIGWIFYGQFNMIFPFVGDNASLFKTTDIIDTYVFRALRTSQSNIGMTAAVGLYQSLAGFIIVIVTNTIVKKVNPDSAIF